MVEAVRTLLHVGGGLVSTPCAGELSRAGGQISSKGEGEQDASEGGSSYSYSEQGAEGSDDAPMTEVGEGEGEESESLVEVEVDVEAEGQESEEAGSDAEEPELQ